MKCIQQIAVQYSLYRSIEEKTMLQTTLLPIMANLDSRLSELNLDVQEVKEMLDIAKRPKVNHPISTSVVIHLCVFSRSRTF